MEKTNNYEIKRAVIRSRASLTTSHKSPIIIPGSSCPELRTKMTTRQTPIVSSATHEPAYLLSPSLMNISSFHLVLRQRYNARRLLHSKPKVGLECEDDILPCSTEMTLSETSPQSQPFSIQKIIRAQILDPVEPYNSLYPPPTRPNSPIFTQASDALNILVVDDNTINLRLMQRYLAKTRSDSVVTACNGIEAVKAVYNSTARKKFDLILMDISMPEMDGFQAVKLIRSFESDITYPHACGDIEGNEEGRRKAHIVAVTTLTSQWHRDEAVQSGFNDFWTKPVSFREIGALLQELKQSPGIY